MADDKIRKIEEKNLSEALCLVLKCFDKFIAPDYSLEGIDAFHKFVDYDLVKEKINSSELLMFSHFENSKIVGVVATRKPCHISLLFVDEKFQKKGIAKALLDKAVGSLEGEKITVNSSPFALKIYKKLGFSELGEEQIANGIRFIPMERIKKPLE